jgi:nucleotide-binding universal stress UspA family protein
MKKMIVVPLDGSEMAETVLPFLFRLVKEEDNQLYLMHVVEYPLDLYEPCTWYPPVEPELLDEIRARKQAIFQEAQAYLGQVANKLSEIGLQANFVVREGPVVETILEASRQLYADLIVIATHGRSGASNGTLGAVADRVLRESETPVILYRPPQADPLEELAALQPAMAEG